MLSAKRLSAIPDHTSICSSAKVKNGDCRTLHELRDASIDAIVTSPPYLNANDYLRGHKLSLIWMGHTIPALRGVRAHAVGTEQAGSAFLANINQASRLDDAVPSVRRLPRKERAMVHKYADDANRMLGEMRRVIVDTGRLVFVLADSCLRGINISNSDIFLWLAKENKFTLMVEEKRDIPINRRYLPINTDNIPLSNRMRQETVQVYTPVS
jgi:tRNA G10  N-methylase Trm11